MIWAGASPLKFNAADGGSKPVKMQKKFGMKVKMKNARIVREKSCRW